MEKNLELSDASLINQLITILNPAGGNTFFVDGVNGSATNNGLAPDAPLLTIKAALALCADGNKDHIYVLDYPSTGGVSGEDEPIVVNKTWVTIEGIGKEGIGGANETQVGPSGDTAIFDVTANYVTLKHMTLFGGASYGAIVCSGASAHALSVLDCTFTPWGTSGYGIYGRPQPGGNSFPRLIVERCKFGSSAALGVITNNGIYIGLNAGGGLIKDCVFDGITGVAINIGTACGPSLQILNNIIRCGSDAKGKAITIANGSSDNIVDGNHAFFGKDAMSTVPYIDDAGADDNHWGINYYDIRAIMPTTT